jgi:hypothetical protein
MSANLLKSLPQDLRYGVRVLAQSPGFPLIAILTLALGIGANTAIFSVVNGVLLNPLPFRGPNQLVSMFQEMPNFKNGSISYPNFIHWRRMNTTFASMAAYRSVGFNLSGNGEPERLHGEMISSGFFEILGVNPLMGRTFTADEDRRGANPTATITEGLWQRKFGGRKDIHRPAHGSGRCWPDDYRCSSLKLSSAHPEFSSAAGEKVFSRPGSHTAPIAA